MIQFNKKLLSLLAAGLFIVVSTGCQRENPPGQEEAAGSSAPTQSGQTGQ